MKIYNFLTSIIFSYLFLAGIFCQAQKNKSNNKKIENSAVKTIEPKIGFTPDISDDAKKKLQRNNELFEKIGKIVNSYSDYEIAKKHLSKRQVEIWENEEEFNKEDHLDVSSWGCSWYCGGGPDSIFVSSKLESNKKLNYKADNVHDFSLRTAWVEGVSGYGIGESITFRFAKKSPPITTINIYNGYMKSDKVWQDNSRVKQIKLFVNNKLRSILNLKDIKSNQIFEIGSIQGIKNDLFLKFEISQVYKGDKYDDVAIAEIEFDGTGVHCFATGTLVDTPNGKVEIEKLKIGDKVFSYDQINKKIEVSTIVDLANQKHHNLYELDFSGIKISVTDDHSFFNNGKFYSIIDNNKYNIQSKSLVLGQEIDFIVDQNIQTKKLTAIKRINSCQMTYTISKLDKNNLFFANGAIAATEEIEDLNKNLR